jgi:hypothetical protein
MTIHINDRLPRTILRFLPRAAVHHAEFSDTASHVDDLHLLLRVESRPCI